MDLSIAAFLLALLALSEGGCPSGFHAISTDGSTDDCYLFVHFEDSDKDKSWRSAYDGCADVGAHLAVLGDVNRVNRADAIVKDTGLNPEDLYWIGLTSDAKSGNTHWIQNEPFKQEGSPWLREEPAYYKGIETYGAASLKGWQMLPDSPNMTDTHQLKGFLCQSESIPNKIQGVFRKDPKKSASSGEVKRVEETVLNSDGDKASRFLSIPVETVDFDDVIDNVTSAEDVTQNDLRRSSMEVHSRQGRLPPRRHQRRSQRRRHRGSRDGQDEANKEQNGRYSVDNRSDSDRNRGSFRLDYSDSSLALEKAFKNFRQRRDKLEEVKMAPRRRKTETRQEKSQGGWLNAREITNALNANKKEKQEAEKQKKAQKDGQKSGRSWDRVELPPAWKIESKLPTQSKKSTNEKTWSKHTLEEVSNDKEYLSADDFGKSGRIEQSYGRQAKNFQRTSRNDHQDGHRTDHGGNKLTRHGIDKHNTRRNHDRFQQELEEHFPSQRHENKIRPSEHLTEDDDHPRDVFEWADRHSQGHFGGRQFHEEDSDLGFRPSEEMHSHKAQKRGNRHPGDNAEKYHSLSNHKSRQHKPEPSSKDQFPFPPVSEQGVPSFDVYAQLHKNHNVDFKDGFQKEDIEIYRQHTKSPQSRHLKNSYAGKGGPQGRQNQQEKRVRVHEENQRPKFIADSVNEAKEIVAPLARQGGLVGDRPHQNRVQHYEMMHRNQEFAEMSNTIEMQPWNKPQKIEIQPWNKPQEQQRHQEITERSNTIEIQPWNKPQEQPKKSYPLRPKHPGHGKEVWEAEQREKQFNRKMALGPLTKEEIDVNAIFPAIFSQTVAYPPIQQVVPAAAIPEAKQAGPWKPVVVPQVKIDWPPAVMRTSGPATPAPLKHGTFKSSLCASRKPGAYPHPEDCNKYIVCFEGQLATEYQCGYKRRWVGSTCVIDQECGKHLSPPKMQFTYYPKTNHYS